MAERDLYLCRRCANAPTFSSYNNLRAHLRAMHRVTQLPNSDLALYETFPGSRHYGPPFNNVDGQDSGNVDQMIQLRDDITRSVVQAINNAQPPAVHEMNVNFQPLLTAFQTMRDDVVRGVKDGIKEAIATVMEQMKESRELSRIEAEDTANTVQIDDPMSVEQNISPTDEKLSAEENPPTGGGDHVVEDQDNGNPVQEPEMPGMAADGTSVAATNTMETQVNPLEGPLAQSTQLEPTKSDEELMEVVLPDDSVTVSQIIAELVRKCLNDGPKIHTLIIVNLFILLGKTDTVGESYTVRNEQRAKRYGSFQRKFA